MKKLGLLMIACCLGIFAYAQETFRLTGELDKASRKAVKQLHLSYINEFGDSICLNTANIKKGKFTFEGNIPQGIDRAYICGFPKGKIEFFLDAGELNTSIINVDDLDQARVYGSHNNDVYNQFLDLKNKDIRENLNKLETYKASLPANIKSDAKLMQAYVDSEEARNATLARLNIMDFIINHLYEKVAVYLIHDYCMGFISSYTMIRDVLESVPANLQQLTVYQDMQNQCLSEEMKEGAKAPVVKGVTPDGKAFSTEDLKGKYVVVTFWDSKDPKSIEEAKFIKEAAKVSDSFNELAIVSFSLDTDKDTWQNAIKQNGMEHANWYHISTLQGMKSKILNWFKIKKLPYTILLNPKGLLIVQDIKGQAIVDKVSRIADGIERYE